MKRTKLIAAVGGLVLAGGLVAAGVGVGWVAADGPHGPGTPVPGVQWPGGFGPMGGAGVMGAYHDDMLDIIAPVLGLTSEQLQAELAAGKTVAQIAQERGVDLTAVQGAMQAAHQAVAPGAGVHGPMFGGGGPGQAYMAAALGLTVDELQKELAAGKTIAQIAQERGVDLTRLHQGMMNWH